MSDEPARPAGRRRAASGAVPARRPGASPLAGPALPDRQRRSDEIIGVLVDEIASGRLERGARLPGEREMAQHFGVSQPTVREAIRALGAMGLVDVRHGSGAYVTGDSSGLVGLALRTVLQLEQVTILQVLDVRMVLGAFAARSAATAADSADLARVRQAAEALEDLQDARDVRDVAERVVAFQVALTAAAHNPLLQALDGFLIVLLTQFQVADDTKDLASWRRWTATYAPARREIAEALAARNEQRLSGAVRTYLQALHDDFAADPALGSVRLHDPQVLREVSRVALSLPDLRTP